MKYPSEYVLSIYGVSETMDEQYFIAFETLEQPLAAWLKDPAHIGHDNPFPRSGKFSLLKEIQ